MKRTEMIARFGEEEIDVLVIGAGINGAVAAAALSDQGLKVAIVDRGDFSSGSSSSSSNLIWGGIKYLENHEYSLVWRLCGSRNLLIKSYPTRIQPICFHLSCPKGFRKSSTLFYIGTLVYWFFGRCMSKSPKYRSCRAIAADHAFINTENIEGAVEYWDAYMPDNDARFSFQFVKKAVSMGAIAVNYMAVDSLNWKDGKWEIDLRSDESDMPIRVSSKAVINASGPHVELLNKKNGLSSPKHILFSKGVHLIVRRITNAHGVFAFFADDGRLFFLLPMGDKSCIGTTDTRVSELPVSVNDEDRKFILTNINRLLRLEEPLTVKDIISERVGVRALVVDEDQFDDKSDWMSLSRKHFIDIKEEESYISVFAGKFTDCINVGEGLIAAMGKLGFDMGKKGKWYGEDNVEDKVSFLDAAKSLGMTLSGEEWALRLWRLYGKDANVILGRIKEDPEKKKNIIPQIDFMLAEAEYACENEMVVELEDLLRRRQMISLTHAKDKLVEMSGFKRLSQVLFGEDWEAKYERWKKDSVPVDISKGRDGNRE
ncbi:MAG: FAD-dependent oxidoreductase [Planctomycetes bacterium]|nr:FAD-dependent oxidoreductase [Planctomycetota bacterium]